MKSSNQTFVAFFSYVRRNDDHDKGRLTSFRKLLEAELWAQTGKDLQIFQDIEDIEWGDNWKEKITKVLDTCTFLIVMVTPSYLESQSCRFEFEYFLNKETRLNRKLILPILYIDTPGLRNKNDEIGIEISKRQYVDWSGIRFGSLVSTKANKKIASLANQIRDLLDDKSLLGLSSDNAIPTFSPELKFNKKEEVTSPGTQIDPFPVIDNFPDGWDSEWQPSFDDVAVVSQPERKFRTKEEDKEHLPKQITVNLRSSGDEERDRRRIKTIYGTLISFHGQDKFSFQIFEKGGKHLLEFPNDTTRISPELLRRLKKLMGEESWHVENTTFQ